MSALGDYIHLKTENYITYGVSHRGAERKDFLAESYQKQKQKNLQQINSLPNVKQSVLTELSNRVQKNFPEGKDKAQEKLKQIISEKKLSEHFKDYILSNITGDLTRKSKIFKNTVATMNTNNDLVNIEEARRLRNNLYKNIDTLNKNFALGKPAGTTPDTIAKNLTDYFKALGMSLPNGGYVVKSEEIKNADILTAMKLILQDISFAQADKATLHGQWGEQTVALCGDVATRKALQEVNGIIVGSHPTSFQLNESIISKSVGKVFYDDTGVNLYRAYSTQDKVDVQIVVNKQPLNVSVKAYTARGNKIRAHLQDVALLTSLATTVGDFANHWLNIHTLNLNSNLLDQALEEHIKYEALVSGNLLKSGSLMADTFVAIDVASGRVYAASTKEILKNKSTSNFILSPKLNTLQIGGNKFVGTWQQRISNILHSVHQTKIKVVLNASLPPK